MKLFFSIIGIVIISLSIPLPALSYTTEFALLDSLPPPPPDYPDTLSGPVDGCVGDTSIYTTDIPLGCTAEWYVNDNLQGSDSSAMQITWTDDGFYTISLYYDCDSGSSFVDSLEVKIYDTPVKPGNIVGDSSVCEYTTHTYSTSVGLNESCEWYVAGELQSSVDTFMVYSFGEAGDYLIEVWALNDCGISNQSSFKMCKAAGLAPDPPEPIEGPEESCVGFTETYTTVIGADEDCQWKVDNIIQETTEPVLEVIWASDGQHEIEARAITDCGSSNPTLLQAMVYETPLINLGNDTLIYEGQTLTLDAGVNHSEYLWSTGESTQTIVVSVSGVYSVIVTNFCGEDTDSIFVDVIVGIPETSINRKLIVSSSGNLLNIETPGQKIVRMQVVDLMGQVIYQGGSKKQICIPGNGVYILKIRTDKATYNRKVLVLRN